MEAADSLFGPGDSSSDPFGSILSSSETTNTEAEQLHTSTTAEAPTHYDGADLFDSYGDGNNYDTQTWSNVDNSDYTSQHPTAAISAGQGHHEQSAYDSYSQWNAYGHPGSQSGSA
jgi:hypothetical protein